MIRKLPHPQSMPGRQRGVVLFIALIVLVAMTLAGIGMMRSVDTANVVAGNLGFKQASLQYADRGVDAAFQWLLANASSDTLTDNVPGAGYYASVSNPKNWNDPTVWTNAVCVGSCDPNNPDDITANRVSYVIHRLCLLPTAYNGQIGGQQNQCEMYTMPGGGATGGSMAIGAFQFSGTPSIYYRITARVQGPRNTVSYVQVMALITQ